MRALSTSAKDWINRALARVQLRLETLTRSRLELERLAALQRSGHFAAPAFPVPAGMRSAAYRELLDEVDRHAARLEEIAAGRDNSVGYRFDNAYYSSPDAEVLYAAVRLWQPGRIFEVGCGNSTKLARLAIRDGGLATRITCIDPAPREDVAALADDLHALPVESAQARAVLAEIAPGDLLFIDSSHRVGAGNDVASLYLNVLPTLPPGTLVQIHDVFLPYDYPYDWLAKHRVDFTEQYLLQAMLTFGERFEVLWAGYYLQRTLPDFERHFARMAGRLAQSLWLRVLPGRAP